MLDPVERSSDPARPRLQAHTQIAQVRAALDGGAKWQHDKFEGSVGGGGRAGPRRVETGHKLCDPFQCNPMWIIHCTLLALCICLGKPCLYQPCVQAMQVG